MLVVTHYLSTNERDIKSRSKVFKIDFVTNINFCTNLNIELFDHPMLFPPLLDPNYAVADSAGALETDLA